ncbi:MAG TPA: ATP-binding protein [Chitinophagaceae bacterium]
MNIFPEDKIVGIFKGFSEGGLEFHADIILKYDNVFQNIPMHGQFLVVALESDREAVLGRITSVAAEGKLAGSAGEDYSLRAVSEGRAVSEDLREGYLKYRVDIRVLGVLRVKNGGLEFAPSHRRLPHVGSKVAFLSDEILQEVAGHNIKNDDGTPAPGFGYLAYGEFVYNGNMAQSQATIESWMMPKSPEVKTKFRIDQMVSRRSFVFARAGFGKSNLVKLLFSNLYETSPQVTKRNSTSTPVGTVIFDPDGEYFWPDDSGRPGLCDVPHLEDKIVVFTNKSSKSLYYQSFVADSIRLDIRRLRPSDVISIALPAERQSQQNVQKLKGLNPANWRRLVDLINHLGNTTPLPDLREIVLGDKDNEKQDVEITAIRSNMTTIIRLLHDPASQMMDKLFESLRNGKLCIVDISQMRGGNGLILSGIVLQQIFEHNQNEFTKEEPKSIPTIAVLEEAQSVLGNNGGGGTDSPYITWVKEGRKFGLGAVLITQQPGSISDEILSQGDNWFIFHLLSAVDLGSLRKANAHFSNDLLSSLLNEPIPGNGIFWSSTGSKPYPISVRVLSFEKLFSIADKDYNRPAGNTFGATIKAKFDQELIKAKEAVGTVEIEINDEEGYDPSRSQEDVLEMYIMSAFKTIKSNENLMAKLKGNNLHWMGLKQPILEALPANLQNKEDIAQECVSRFMNENFGPGKWTTEKRPSKTKTGFTSYLLINQ